MAAMEKKQPEEFDRDEIPGIRFLNAEEGRALFDRQARELVGLTGEEFLRQWDSGTYQPTIGPDGEDRKLNRLLMSLPFVGRSLS